MKGKLLFISLFAFILFGSTFFSSCDSCSRNKQTTADEVASVLGVYSGEASIILPDHIKAMIKPDENGNTLIPQDPIPCKIEITSDEENNLILQLKDFKMPVEGVVINPSKSSVKLSDENSDINGSGNVTYGQQTIKYNYKGTVKNEELNLEITVVVVPFVIEPKINFIGKKVKK